MCPAPVRRRRRAPVSGRGRPPELQPPLAQERRRGRRPRTPSGTLDADGAGSDDASAEGFEAVPPAGDGAGEGRRAAGTAAACTWACCWTAARDTTLLPGANAAADAARQATRTERIFVYWVVGVVDLPTNCSLGCRRSDDIRGQSGNEQKGAAGQEFRGEGVGRRVCVTTRGRTLLHAHQRTTEQRTHTHRAERTTQRSSAVSHMGTTMRRRCCAAATTTAPRPPGAILRPLVTLLSLGERLHARLGRQPEALAHRQRGGAATLGIGGAAAQVAEGV